MVDVGMCVIKLYKIFQLYYKNYAVNRNLVDVMRPVMHRMRLTFCIESILLRHGFN